MKHKTLRIALPALLLAALVLTGVLLLTQQDGEIAQGNLIRNGTFTEVHNGMPSDWIPGMWLTNVGTSYLEAVTLEDGTTAALVENVAANDARFEQIVPVQENATYKLTARVRAEGCDTTKIGANVSFLGVYGSSDPVYDTNGGFETVTVYGQTGSGQTEITVCVRLGFYGSEASGRAWFTDVELTQVESAPVGVQVINLSTPKPQQQETEHPGGTGVISGSIVLSMLYLAAGVCAALFLLRPRERELLAQEYEKYVLVVILGTAGMIRLGLAGMVEGYGVDMGCFGAWAGRMAQMGPASFYVDDYFCDYPPGYMLVLWLVGLLSQATGISLGGMDGQFLIKLTPVFCDVILAIILYAAARKRLGGTASLGIAALMAFNPAYMVTSACWGQTDAVLSLLLVIMLLFAHRGKWQAAIPVFALAVLVKPQAGLLAPLGVAALIKDIADAQQRKDALRRMLIGLGAGVAVTLAIVMPFSPNQEPMWLVNKYLDTLLSYDFATLSTGNLMFLLGGNWKENVEPLLGVLTYGHLGMALMLLSFAAGIVFFFKGKGRSQLMLSAAATMQLIFVLGTKMHERYILPALALLMLAYIKSGDIRLLISAIISSCASYVNIQVVLAYDYLIDPNLWLGYLLGAVQLLAAAVTVWAAIDMVFFNRTITLPKAVRREEKEEELLYAADVRVRRELLEETDYGRRLRKRDWAVMLALTLAYGLIGFSTLGTSNAPQTGYVSSAREETVVIDLGVPREDFRIYYYGGISDTQFSFAVSDDGITFGEETDAFFDRGTCFMWQALRMPIKNEAGTVTGSSGAMLTFSGRYLRVTFKDAGSALWEVAAVDGDGNVYPAVWAQGAGGVSGREADAASLIDEQDTVPEKPTWHNSMYFDEIYHARTGYEHAHALYTYETTHPPLGKVFMSLCIDAMGMTPFAWRFAGALCGVLMVPAMYLLAKQLLRKTRWAALCAGLMAADCMHFTQTRIATIDSFPVLFMMLMFLFMVRWMQMSFYHQRFGRTLVPLALSGAFMGLAIASKWIGCYGAVGLALLFFSRFYELWRQYRHAKTHREEDPAFARAAALFPRYGAATIAACVLFFVIIPIAIYVLSYIPYLRAYGEVTWNLKTFERIWDAQVLMFDYHKNLVAEHYFGSPWYEWPLIIKPIWYYNGDFNAPGMASSILSFGNPAVWWTGFAGILFVLAWSLKHNVMPALRIVSGRDDAYDRALPVIAVGFLSAYLPWVLVSRLTFIYHYFASVPFIILAAAQGLRYMERKNRRLALTLAWLLAALAAALFFAYYPLASGIEVPRAWCDAVSVFDNWMWY